ncbi:MAG: hypothetical protein ACXVAO_04970 [Vulcanimicrobiaceae bacterium]
MAIYNRSRMPSFPDDATGLDERVQTQYIALEFNRMLADPAVDGVGV